MGGGGQSLATQAAALGQDTAPLRVGKTRMRLQGPSGGESDEAKALLRYRQRYRDGSSFVMLSSKECEHLASLGYDDWSQVKRLFLGDAPTDPAGTGGGGGGRRGGQGKAGQGKAGQSKAGRRGGRSSASPEPSPGRRQRRRAGQGARGAAGESLEVGSSAKGKGALGKGKGKLGASGSGKLGSVPSMSMGGDDGSEGGGEGSKGLGSGAKHAPNSYWSSAFDTSPGGAGEKVFRDQYRFKQSAGQSLEAWKPPSVPASREVASLAISHAVGTGNVLSLDLQSTGPAPGKQLKGRDPLPLHRSMRDLRLRMEEDAALGRPSIHAEAEWKDNIKFKGAAPEGKRSWKVPSNAPSKVRVEMRNAEAVAKGKVLSLDLCSTGPAPGTDVKLWYSGPLESNPKIAEMLAKGGSGNGHAEDEWHDFVNFKRNAGEGRPTWVPTDLPPDRNKVMIKTAESNNAGLVMSLDLRSTGISPGTKLARPGKPLVANDRTTRRRRGHGHGSAVNTDGRVGTAGTDGGGGGGKGHRGHGASGAGDGGSSSQLLVQEQEWKDFMKFKDGKGVPAWKVPKLPPVSDMLDDGPGGHAEGEWRDFIRFRGSAPEGHPAWKPTNPPAHPHIVAMATSEAVSHGQVLSLDLAGTGPQPGRQVLPRPGEIAPGTDRMPHHPVVKRLKEEEACEVKDVGGRGGHAEDEWKDYVSFKRRAPTGSESFFPGGKGTSIEDKHITCVGKPWVHPKDKKMGHREPPVGTKGASAKASFR